MTNTGMGNWRGATHADSNLASSHTGLAMSPLDAYRSAHNYAHKLQQSLSGYEDQVVGVVQHIHSLSNVIESLRLHYEAVVEERDYVKRALADAEESSRRIQGVLERYASVTDPVVASDGYTYEREVIAAYLDDCQSQDNTPKSQQTGKELTMMLLPNRSFKRFLNQLIEVKPAEGRANNCGSGSTKTGSSSAPAGKGTAGGQDAKWEGGGGDAGPVGTKTERLHPCVRVYGFCNYKDDCAYALYPYDACLSHLKGKCRFRTLCHEPHVDFRGQLNPSDVGGDARGGGR